MPRVGDFGLVEIDSTAGKAIRIGQWLNGDGFANWEHAFIYLGSGNVLEARPSGAGLSRAPIARSVLWSSWPLTDKQRSDIYSVAMSLVGTPYSWLDYVALAAHRFHVPAPHLRRYIADSGHMICSQLVDYCYQRAGIQLFDDGRWPGDVTPADLAKVWRTNKK